MKRLYPILMVVALVASSQPAAAQSRSAGSVVVAADMSIVPALEALGLSADVRVWRGVEVIGSVQRKGDWRVSCIESSPSPCSPKGISLVAGLRLVAESGEGWWPYAEGVYGGHRYSSQSDWRPYWDVGAGAGFYVGAGGIVRVGLNYGRAPADPPPVEEWRRPGDTYTHTFGRIVFGAGVRVH